MSYNAGEIYFVREVDRDGKTTDFVKIGLVKAPRTSFDRLSEHQTGNPRRLEIPDGHIVSTEAVSFVEARLHREFAKERIGGEWFQFSSDERLNEVIEVSRNISLEVTAAKGKLVRAEELETVPSNGVLREPTEDDWRVANWHLAAKEKMKTLASLEGDLLKTLKKSSDEGHDLGTVAKEKTVTFKSKFDEEQFINDYPELVLRYTVSKDAWSQRFILKHKLAPDWEPDENFTRETEEIKSLLAKAIYPQDLEEPSWRLTKLKAVTEWEVLVSQSELKSLVGDNEGIAGICTWKRQFVQSSKFDATALYAEDPELFQAYLLDEVTKTYIVPAKGSKRR